jgi:hypothetical protein
MTMMMLFAFSLVCLAVFAISLSCVLMVKDTTESHRFREVAAKVVGVSLNLFIGSVVATALLAIFY